MRQVYVFGSNRQGRHGKGCAKVAFTSYGAVYGQSEGPQGNSYAIVTKELRTTMPPVTLAEIRRGVNRFLQHALDNPNTEFIVTAIGCGLAGFEPEDIAPMFANVPDNVTLPLAFRRIIWPSYVAQPIDVYA